MSKWIHTALLLFMGSSAFAQVNYVLNPDFEQYTSCPTNNDQISLCKNWSGIDSIGFNQCDPDFCHTCVKSPNVVNTVPQSYGYWQHPRSGQGMAQVIMYYDEYRLPNFQIRNYLQGRLSQKLSVGKRYCVSFYVVLEEMSRYAVKEVSAYLDNGSIDTAFACGTPQIRYAPQITHSGGVIIDTMNWTRIEGSFVATGTEQFITIGNFKDKVHTTYIQVPLDPLYDIDPHYSFYLIDDVSVIESDLKADAGKDTHVGKGDSVYIGRTKEVGLECTWSVLGSTAIIGTGAGMWVRPAATTSYVVTQTLCGLVKKDTVRVEVWAAGVHSVNGQAQQYTLSPNPANGLIRLSQSVADELPVSVSIYESSGRQVHSGRLLFKDGGALLDMSGMAPGFYYIQLQDSSGNGYTLKLVKQ